MVRNNSTSNSSKKKLNKNNSNNNNHNNNNKDDNSNNDANKTMQQATPAVRNHIQIAVRPSAVLMHEANFRLGVHQRCEG